MNVKSYENKWTIHGIIQNLGYYPPTANLCVMMRDNLKTNCCEYIAVYQDDQSPTPENTVNTLENKYKPNVNADFHLGAKYLNDPGGKMVCQLKKYLEEIHAKFTKLFTDNPPKDLETYFKIIKILITKGNATLMPSEATDEHLNGLS